MADGFDDFQAEIGAKCNRLLRIMYLEQVKR